MGPPCVPQKDSSSLVSLRQAFRQPSIDKLSTPYRYVVYVRGDDSDTRLLQIVEKISQRNNTFITIAFVVEVQQSMPLDAELPAEIERGERVLHEAEQFASRCVGGRRENVRTELLQARSAGAAIVDEAMESGADAILMASVLKKRYGRLEMGEAVEYVLLNAPCEVVVVRQASADWQTHNLEHA